MSVNRIYIVTAPDGCVVLVKASNQAQALRHVAKFADRAALVLATLEAENSDEEEQIQQIIDGISTWAPPAMLGDVTANAEVSRSAPLLAQVGSTDGLCPDD